MQPLEFIDPVGSVANGDGTLLQLRIGERKGDNDLNALNEVSKSSEHTPTTTTQYNTTKSNNSIYTFTFRTCTNFWPTHTHMHTHIHTFSFGHLSIFPFLFCFGFRQLFLLKIIIRFFFSIEIFTH